MHPNPGKVRRGYRGGTAVRGDGVRVFRQFTWLEVGSGKAASSRLAYATRPSSPSVGRSAGVLTRREPRQNTRGRTHTVGQR
jgi:hypothetical protein